MRIRQVVVVLVAVASTLAGSGVASACRICDPFLHCITQGLGAIACVEGPSACALFGQCLSGKGKIPDGGNEFLTTWSLFDAAGRPAPSLRTEAGDISLGEEARATAGQSVPAGALADAALAFGEEFALSFVDGAGDGFAIQRSEEGGRVRLEVRDVTGDMPGRVLASESLGPRDQLSVPVRVEGRDRVLLLQAADLRGGGGPHAAAAPRAAAARTRALARAIHEPSAHGS